MRHTKDNQSAIPDFINASPPKPRRHRNAAYLWADKQVLRYLRENFSRTHYKNLRSIYLALCEIDSDSEEGIQINKLAKTIAAYTGIDKKDAIKRYLQALQELQIINYEDEEAALLIIYKWEEWDEPTWLRKETALEFITREIK